jgi:MinD superfamily P-loop ATPase
VPPRLAIVVASGKGGTGKTTVAVNLALALGDSRPVQFHDCDVEAPNAHFFLRPRIESREEVSLPIPEVDESRCDMCGTCADVCAYHALAAAGDSVLLFPELCHGCGACSRLCPAGAIREVPRRLGVIESGRAGSIDFLQGRLDVGRALSPPLIRALGKRRTGEGAVIIDAPPGSSCAVVASLRGSDFCLLVSEPTPFGLHDLELAAEAARQLGLPSGVLINRAGAAGRDDGLRAFCAREGLPVLMTIPFERRIAEAYSRGRSLIEDNPDWRPKFLRLATDIEARLG